MTSINFPQPPDNCWRFKQVEGEWYFLTIVKRNEFMILDWVPINDIIRSIPYSEIAKMELEPCLLQVRRDDLINSASTEWERKYHRLRYLQGNDWREAGCNATEWRYLKDSPADAEQISGDAHK